MKTTVRIGEAIYSILKPLERVYPIIADEGTTFPFIVYRRATGYSQSTKDGIYSVTATIEVKVAADDYPTSVEWADKVIKAMEGAKGTIKDYKIINIRMVDSDENYTENAFVQTLRFSVEFTTA